MKRERQMRLALSWTIIIFGFLAFLWLLFLLQESGATGCKEVGGTPVRNALGEYVDCIN